MNYDNDLDLLKDYTLYFTEKLRKEILMINTAKHRAEMVQQLDKACHYAVKMFESFNDLNQWLSAFGPDHDDRQDPDYLRIAKQGFNCLQL